MPLTIKPLGQAPATLKDLVQSTANGSKPRATSGSSDHVGQMGAGEAWSNSVKPRAATLVKPSFSTNDPDYREIFGRFREVFQGQDALVQELQPLFQELTRRKKAEKADPRGRLLHRDKPIVMVLTGEPGAGKTLLATALSYAYHGKIDGESRVATINGSEIATSGVSYILGAAPGYVGHDATSGRGFHPNNVKKLFGDRQNRMLLLDDVDKVRDPKVLGEVITVLNNAMESGKLTFSDGQVLDLRNDLILITGNFGVDKLRETNRNPSPADYKRVAVQFFVDNGASQIVDRIKGSGGGFYGLKTLDKAERRRVLEKRIESYLAKEFEPRLLASDRAVKVIVDPAALDLLGELADTARRAGNIVANVVAPMVDALATQVGDEEVWKLTVDPVAARAFLNDLAKARALDPEADLPAEYKVDPSLLPFGFEQIAAAPRYQEATIKDVPYSNAIMSSGFAAGKLYYTAFTGNAGNAMVVRVNGAYKTIELPNELKNAQSMFPISSVTLDDTHVLLVGVDCPKKGGTAKAVSYVADLSGATPTFQRTLNDPMVAKQGGALGGAAGKALWAGGRVPEWDGASWSVPSDATPDRLVEVPIAGADLTFDLASMKWSVAATQLPVPLWGSGVANVKDEVWFVGGEESFTTGRNLFGPQQGVLRTRATAGVSIWNPATGTVRPGPTLQSPVVFPYVENDGVDRINVRGGFATDESSGCYLPMTASWRLNTSMRQTQWLPTSDLPAALSSTQVTRLPLDEMSDLLIGLNSQKPQSAWLRTRRPQA